MNFSAIRFANRLDSQELLFSLQANRLGLLGVDLPRSIGTPVYINVWRNHNFESLSSLSEPYFAFLDWPISFRIGMYDDSLLFQDYRSASAELLWLDSKRYLQSLDFDEWLSWLDGRISILRRLTIAPIIVATWFDDPAYYSVLNQKLDAYSGVYIADLNEECAKAKVPLLDLRAEALSGTPLSKNAQVILAKKLACHWLPATLLPPIKAIALDLDNTLHDGVLGEDGIFGVQLTDAYIILQNFVKSLRERGVFIALVSRNNLSDVEALFEKRTDYPLSWSDFSAIEISWNDKHLGLERIAQNLNIGTNAILFVDDNLGELSNVNQILPQIHIVHAKADPNLTCNAIEYYPGLWRWNVEPDDTKRINDLKANKQRAEIADSVSDMAEYFQSLQVTITINNNPLQQISRISDLCNKTNQFNLALRRFNQTQIAEYVKRYDTCVTSVQLADRLTDSGVIAAIVTERKGDVLSVLELCISCRALGRQLENTIILGSLSQMPIYENCKEIVFSAQIGPRNQPALSWLAQLLGVVDLSSSGKYTIKASRLMDFNLPNGIKISIIS
jgi:FkbH-like protein